MEKSSLIDIEKKYACDVVKFFSEEYSKPERKIGSNEIKFLIDTQIEKRIYDSIIKNWKVDVFIFDASEKRDGVIDNILNDSNKFFENRVSVYLEFRDSSMIIIETIIR